MLGYLLYGLKGSRTELSKSSLSSVATTTHSESACTKKSKARNIGRQKA